MMYGIGCGFVCILSFVIGLTWIMILLNHVLDKSGRVDKGLLIFEDSIMAALAASFTVLGYKGYRHAIRSDIEQGGPGLRIAAPILILSLIVVCLMIAWPSMVRSPMSVNEAGAIENIRTIRTAQERYLELGLNDLDGDGTMDYATLDELGDLPNSNSDSIPFVSRKLAGGATKGYKFTITVTPSAGGEASYSAVALPITPGRTGIKTLFVDETGIIRFANDGTAANQDSAPIN